MFALCRSLKERFKVHGVSPFVLFSFLFFFIFASSESTQLFNFEKDAKQVYLFQEIEAQETSRNVSLCPLSTLSFFLSTWNINPSGVCILLVFNFYVKNNKKYCQHGSWNCRFIKKKKKGRWKVDSEFL